ncbi:MAG: hypothetical protein ACXW3Z_04280 [Limisphaerales bacterium]
MQFLKAHYEKVILSVVLLGLLAAAALMPMKVSRERENEERRKEVLLPQAVKPLTPVDLTTNAQSVAKVEVPKRVTLAGSHNVFNPVRWQRNPDGSIYRAQDAGPGALKITDIRPLHLRVEFDQVSGSPEEPRYRLLVLNEVQRGNRPTPRDAGVGDKNNMFMIEKVIGDNPSNPDALQVLLAGDKESVRITKQEPFQRIIGNTADIQHPLEKKQWTNQKVKDELTFGGETYNIVAITPHEVVLSAKSNKKQTVLEFDKAAPEK